MILFFYLVPIRLWISALAAGVKISIFTLIGMRIRNVAPAAYRIAHDQASKAGLSVTINMLETHYLAGGDVDKVINALIGAPARQHTAGVRQGAGPSTSPGGDVFMAVRMSVNPKVIETPVVAAIAKDGIELRAKSARDGARQH